MCPNICAAPRLAADALFFFLWLHIDEKFVWIPLYRFVHKQKQIEKKNLKYFCLNPCVLWHSMIKQNTNTRTRALAHSGAISKCNLKGAIWFCLVNFVVRSETKLQTNYKRSKRSSIERRTQRPLCVHRCSVSTCKNETFRYAFSHSLKS